MSFLGIAAAAGGIFKGAKKLWYKVKKPVPKQNDVQPQNSTAQNFVSYSTNGVAASNVINSVGSSIGNILNPQNQVMGFQQQQIQQRNIFIALGAVLLILFMRKK
jgi:hypothetical protein